MSVHIKRIYDEPSGQDGYRILVDRLWPRGVSKQEARLDTWLKDVAPSTELRVWFGHQPERFKEFTVRYQEELRANPAVDELRRLIKEHGHVTLLYGARDPKVNHAIVLRDYLS
jgi:uncharacterized protein YeaO (DUF488 family)